MKINLTKVLVPESNTTQTPIPRYFANGIEVTQTEFDRYVLQGRFPKETTSFEPLSAEAIQLEMQHVIDADYNNTGQGSEYNRYFANGINISENQFQDYLNHGSKVTERTSYLHFD